jgi:acetate kinase
VADNDAVLVLNAGSSSIKFALFRAGRDGVAEVFRGKADDLAEDPRLIVRDGSGRTVADQAICGHGNRAITHEAALDCLLGWFDAHDDAWRVIAAGHRVTHGGPGCYAPVAVTSGLLDTLERLAPLAPLHQPHNIEGIRALARVRSDLPQVACFDTAFHATQPEVETHYALPEDIVRLGVRRYGFHGLSYEYIASVLPQHLGAAADGRVVVAHLGNGASMCGMHGRRSVATTMGFTAVEGLVMGTRCGTLDPGVVLYLIEQQGQAPAAVRDALYNRSGLLGLSGLSNDMRTLLASSDRRARLAIDVFVHRIVREIGSLAAAMGGLDAIVFTAGIGENAAPVRARTCVALEWLGLHIDMDANDRHATRISRQTSRVGAWVIPTNEELMIARHTLAIAVDAVPAAGAAA